MIERASEEERDRRRAICQNCPFVRIHQLTKNRQFMQCTQCGCALALKTKFLRAQCPAGKW